jgi:PPOX class probable F420-dependent enzyme
MGRAVSQCHHHGPKRYEGLKRPRERNVRLAERRQATGMLSETQRSFLADRKVGHLATADRFAVPHVVPVCFVLSEDTVYITIDEKPKAGRTPLKRLANITENPAVAFVSDRYHEDWSLLGWVMLWGRAQVLPDGPEHDKAQALLRFRYPQLKDMRISALPVIAIRIERVASWGNLWVATAE